MLFITALETSETISYTEILMLRMIFSLISRFPQSWSNVNLRFWAFKTRTKKSSSIIIIYVP